jgi:hypothetical protein
VTRFAKDDEIDTVIKEKKMRKNLVYFPAFAPRYTRLWTSIALVPLCLLALGSIAYGQSTFGTVLGTVRDPSGSVVLKADIQLVNTGTNIARKTESTLDGTYKFVNIDTGTYQLSVEAAGFQKTNFQPFDLGARETKRIDIDLRVASEATTVNVVAVPVIQTDVSNVAETKGSLELNDLPVAVNTRSQGSTSAFSTLTAQPGVQIDNQNNIAVASATPSQVSITVDGISSVGPGSYGALTEVFPSFNAIEEIKISETLNPAEYGNVADVTTISKSGTNSFHGGLFENLQNTAFNASDYFSHQVSPIHLNDFGAYVGGPVVIPGLYNGHNKTFFFASGELLRLPRGQTAILSVPTQAMRNGDLSAYLSAANGGSTNQLTGYQGNIIPQGQISSFSQKLLNLFYPLPNFGPAGAISDNYLGSYRIPINSAQFDMRVDEQLNSKNLVYARYSFKNRSVTTPPTDSSGNPGSPLVGATFSPEIDNAFTVAYNWIISPRVFNELRGGWTSVRRNTTFGVTAQGVADELGLTSPPLPTAIPPGTNIPTVSLSGFIGLHDPGAYVTRSESTYQFLDTLTWSKAKHTMKFGMDFRYLNALFTAAFADFQLGNYIFNGTSSATTSLLGSGAAVPMASFLLGYPDTTGIAAVTNPDTDSWSKHYALFAQDDWKVSQSLTLNYGLRWEYNPPFGDRNENIANFDPAYTSVVNGQTVHGAVIVPNQFALTNVVYPGFTQSIFPTPVITAAQAGIPSTLQFGSKKDFAPRIGFAWRVFRDNKTVLRGGYGRFIQTLTGGSASNGWAIASSDAGFFTNSTGSNGKPVFQVPYSFPSNIAAAVGTQFFDLGVQIHGKDPIVEQWNLTLEHDLGSGVGVRASYDGNHSYNVPAFMNIDQQHPNTTGYNAALTPFPLLADIVLREPVGFGNYQAGTISVHKRARGVQFEGSYVYTRNLTNVYGAYSSTSAFIKENIAANLSDPYNTNLDYGNTPWARRNRFLFTFLYELPFGQGKTFLNSSNLLVDRIVGGWMLSGITVFQSGPFMSVTTLNDPSGTGYNLFNGIGGRADVVGGANPYQGQSTQQWINPNAFADPANNIGRFGNSGAGSVVGPGTQNVSLALLKRISFTESTRLEIGAQVSNLANHPNFNPPSTLSLGVPGFGALTSLQSAEGAGPRAMQLVGRFTF